jgi:OOP family OmpA-OmpF porin/outer membrane immunogenic protein
MKSSLFALALATAAAVPTLGFAADNGAGNGGFFVNGNIGQSNLSKGAYDDNDTGYGANVGYRWALNPSVALGVEGGYTNLGNFDPKDGLGALGIARAKVDGWNLGVNGHFNITPNWYVSARGGLFHGDVKGGYFAGPVPVYVDDTSNKYYAGAGFGYDFSNNLSVGVNYDYYKVNKDGLNLDPSLVSVSAEYRFQ